MAFIESNLQGAGAIINQDTKHEDSNLPGVMELSNIRAKLQEQKQMEFHQCLTPRGMTWYNLNVLTKVQQKLLTDLKIDTIRENNQYLAKHPEIHALIALFLRSVLMNKPVTETLGIYAANFFTRSREKLELEIISYLKEVGEPKKHEGDSAVNIRAAEFPTTQASSAVTITEDLTSLDHNDYFSYLSYTDDEKVQMEAESTFSEKWSDVETECLDENQEELETHVPSLVLEPVETKTSDVFELEENHDEEDMLRLLFSSQVKVTAPVPVKKPSLRQSTENIIRYLLYHESANEEYGFEM